ncbi:MAG: sulfotransferase [Nocardioidaceae bacterium]|nr:sulfotransferase [Nocardioidaceae bacterium]
MVAQLDRQYLHLAGPGAGLRRAISYAFYEGRPATTRGQWFNPVVARVLRRAEQAPAVPPDRPVFVLGTGRSGTTHLGRLLSAHPQVGWLNEPKLMWSRLVPGEDVSGFYQPAGRFVLGPDDATAELRQAASAVLTSYLRTVRATRAVVKYPELTYRARFLEALFPDAVLVAIVRRPEDVVHSVAGWNARNAAGDEDWWGVGDRKWRQLCEQLAPADPLLAAVLDQAGDEPLTPGERAATEWVLGARALAEARACVDLRVRYDDLVADPAGTMRRVLAACGLDPDPRVLALAEASTVRGPHAAPAGLGRLADAVAAVRGEVGL